MNAIPMIVASLVMISAFFAAANFIAWRLFDRPRHALAWAITFALAAVQYSLNLLRGADILISSDVFWLSANMTSFLLILTAHWGHRERLGLPTPWPVFTAVLVLMSLINLVVVVGDLRGARLAIAPAFTFINMSAVTWILLAKGRGLRLPNRLAAATHFSFGLTQLGAAGIALYSGNQMTPREEDLYHLANFLFMPALYVAMGVSVILLLATDLSRQLRVQALTDQLTGLNNRRGFLAASERMLARVGRSGSPMALVLCDVDHFKRVNDSFGHAAGDEALRQLAGVIAATVRAGDETGRIGGEEFAICVEGLAAEDVAGICERINRELAVSVLETARGPLSLSASFGVTTARGGDTVEDLFQRADQALYQAKAEGRNTVRIG